MSTNEVLITRAPLELRATDGGGGARGVGWSAGGREAAARRAPLRLEPGGRRGGRLGDAPPPGRYAIPAARAHRHSVMHSTTVEMRPQPEESSALQGRMRALKAVPATPPLLLPTCGGARHRGGN